MKKSSFLFGISLSSILAAAGANAAGYTCEELIEYTSCMPGYYLEPSQSCPDGYMYITGVCDHTNYSDDVDWNMTEEECYESLHDDEVYLESICLQADEVSADVFYAYGITGWEQPIASATQCSECPSGSICAGGTADKAPCPAGAYCEGAGLSAVSGKCALGSYSTGGATKCEVCPTTGLTDKDGKIVIATTAETGATAVSACIIGDKVEFQDVKGIWHYKNSCAYGSYPDMFPVLEHSDGTEFCPASHTLVLLEEDEAFGDNYCVRMSQEKCDNLPANDDDIFEWDGSQCVCRDGIITYNAEKDRFGCFYAD